MTNPSRSAALAITLAMSGCASAPPPLSRADYLALASRSYQGVAKERAIEAARRVLLLAYDHEASFVEQPDGFVASAGPRAWEITARETTDGGVAMFVQAISRIGQMSVVATPGTLSGIGGITSSATGNSASAGTRGLYQLWWARMDYMLHRSDQWVTCTEAKAASAYDDLGHLCTVVFPDYSPGAAKRVTSTPAGPAPGGRSPGAPRAIDREPLGKT